MSAEIMLIIFFFAGSFAGTLAGLLGIGGGLVYVPLLVYLLPKEGIPAAMVMHVAVATSLTVIAVTSLSSMRAHHKRGGIRWNLFRHLLPGLIIGAILGANIADFLPSHILKIIFGLFVLLIAARMIFNWQPTGQQSNLPGPKGLFGVGVGIAGLCSILGMGGGTLIVPYLRWRAVDMRNAVATSAACGFPIAFIAALAFLLTGLRQSGLPDWTYGYVYWPAFLGLAIGSMLFVPLGARLTHHLSVPALNRIFAIFLLIVGSDMCFR